MGILRRFTMSKTCMYIALAVILSFTMKVNSYSEGGDATMIRCAGADISQGKMHTTARLFMKANPGIKVDLAKAPTLDAGIDSVLNGKADVAIACRQINQTEKEQANRREVAISGRLIGRGPIVLVTHTSNAVSALTVEQVKGILTGEHTNWNQIGGSDQPIELLTPDSTSPGEVIFLQDEFLDGARFTDKSRQISSFLEILREVSKRPGAIGCVRIKAIEIPRPAEEQIKILAIKKNADGEAVLPSRENARNGTYPLSRPYYVYYNSKASHVVRNFVDFVVAKGTGPGF
jgi:phosphate transport system substrate-binding protein